jgi:hypothetical protein
MILGGNRAHSTRHANVFLKTGRNTVLAWNRILIPDFQHEICSVAVSVLLFITNQGINSKGFNPNTIIFFTKENHECYGLL